MRRKEARAYRLTCSAIPVFLALYCVVVLHRESVPGRGEIFPIASWSLFSMVPNSPRDYSLRFIAVDGQKLPHGVFFEDSGEYFSQHTNHAARVAIDRMGRAFDADDMLTVHAVRRTFENLFLTEATQVRYELVARIYDPLIRYRTGAFAEVTTLTSFSAGAP